MKEEKKKRSGRPRLSPVYNEMKLDFPSHSRNEGFARAAAAAFISSADPTATELSDIKCALSEAVTNCIVHAYKNELGKIYITAELIEPNTIKIKIRDKGCGIENVEKAMEPLYTTVGGERAGLGFAVMQSFMDKIKVTSKPDKGTCITLEKNIIPRVIKNG